MFAVDADMTFADTAATVLAPLLRVPCMTGDSNWNQSAMLVMLMILFAHTTAAPPRASMAGDRATQVVAGRARASGD